jgi:hypothetical protein
MSVQPDRLPTRFPVGTRYVVEGRGGANGALRIRSRYLEFPDGRHMDLPISQLPAVRSLRRRPGYDGRVEKNFEGGWNENPRS